MSGDQVNDVLGGANLVTGNMFGHTTRLYYDYGICVNLDSSNKLYDKAISDW
jgi:hypothetical protein